MHERWLDSVRHVALAILLLGAGCGPRSGLAEAPRPERGEAPATVKTAEAPSTVTISGRIRAHDGSPLKQGEVTVQGGLAEVTASLDEAGAFSLEVPRGVVIIWLAGVDHAPSARRTLLTGPLAIDGTLGTYSTPPAEPDLEIVGQFLDAEGQPVGPAPSRAARTPSGVHQLDLSERPAAATALRYQVRTPGGRPINGPVADRYTYNGRGSFSSIVDLGERATLEIDLGTVPPAKRPAEIGWSGEDDATVAILAFERRWKKKRRALKIGARSPPEPARVAALQAEARAEADAVTDPILQGLFRGAVATVFDTGLDDAHDPAFVHAEAAWFIEHIAPDDIHLALVLGVANTVHAALESNADPKLAARINAWLERGAADNPDPDAALSSLSTLLWLAEHTRDDARRAERVAQLRHPRFEGHQYRNILVQQYADRPLMRGKTLPPFEYAALEPHAPPVDREGRAGRVYLLEFWATWCKPCVEDMPNLHAAYAVVNGAKAVARDESGLRTLAPVADPVVEFVFVSFDATPEEVGAFRTQHWSMPWTHAYPGDEHKDSIMKTLGFTTLPTSVLVDEQGTILEVGAELHGERLLPTLRRVLAERDAP